MIAQPSPFARRHAPAACRSRACAQQAPPQGQGGFKQASPTQKTIVAGMAPPIMGGQMMQPGADAAGMIRRDAAARRAVRSGGRGPNKTVMLQPSEGVVSVARAAVRPLPAPAGEPAAIQQGASTLSGSCRWSSASRSARSRT